MGHIPLKPLTPNDERPIPGFSVCDIEASDWIKFLVIGLAWKKYDQLDNLEEERYEYFTDLGEFCDFVFEQEHPHKTIFAHFGGKYDYSFILKEYFFNHEKYRIHKIIPRGSGLLCFSISTFTRELEPDPLKEEFGKTDDGYWLVEDRTIEFRDSSAMLPFSLASLTERFGVEHKKQEIDYEKITCVTPELLEYLEYDCWGLYECIEKYFRWPMIRRSGPASTIASQSLKVFRTFLKKPIPSLKPETDAFVRASYFGGRTEIFKPFYEQHRDDSILRSFDVNSLYPSVMRDFEFPGGAAFETQFYLENRMGFYDVEVTVPEMYVPPLGMRYEGMEHRLIFPTGTFRGIWSTVDLNYAMTLGVKINKVYHGIVFHSIGYIFKDYIEYLYKRRKESPKGSVDDVLCKLLMNSTYGRFGLNLHREQLTFDNGQMGVNPHMEIELDEEGKNIIRLMKTNVYLESSFTNVAVAAWVTSLSRVRMHQLIMEAPEEMYYMDTDSLKTTHNYSRNDDDLGKLKLEYLAKRACFVLPKTYMEDTTSPIFSVYDDAGKISKELKTSKKIVMKGFDKKKIAKFTVDDFTSALEGDMRRLRTMNPKKFATLKTAIKKNEFLMLLNETPRQIRTRYNKRRVFKRAYNQVYDTEALHIVNGDVVNIDKDILKKWKMPSDFEFDQIEQRAMGGL